MFSQSFKLNQVGQQKLFRMHYESKFKVKFFLFLTWTFKLRHLGLDFGIFNCIFGFLTIQNLPVPIFMMFTHLYVEFSIILAWPWISRSQASNVKRPFWAKFQILVTWEINNCNLKLGNFVCPIRPCNCAKFEGNLRWWVLDLSYMYHFSYGINKKSYTYWLDSIKLSSSCETQSRKNTDRNHVNEQDTHTTHREKDEIRRG